MLIYQDDLRKVVSAMNGARWANRHARGGIAMPALIGEGGVQCQARFSVNTWFGSGRLENGQEQIFGLRMGYCAGRFALFTANTTFRVYKDSFHAGIPFSKPCEKNGISIDVSQNTSSLKTYPPPMF
jgi:hypothetical protein